MRAARAATMAVWPDSRMPYRVFTWQVVSGSPSWKPYGKSHMHGRLPLSGICAAAPS